MIEHIAIPEERIKILRNDRKLENELKKLLNIKLKIDDDISIEGEDSIQLLRTKEVIKAFGRGFDTDSSLNLLDEDYFLETIEVKAFAGKSRDRQITLKGRVIGKDGKTKKMIEKYAEVEISIYGKTISIIGKWDNIRIAREAIEMLLSGCKHNTVYRFLKEQKVI